MKKVSCLIASLLVLLTMETVGQVNTVEFGKNRIQYQKFKWKYYQTDNFNCYFSQDGLGLGKYVAQVAEAELPGIEEFVEYGLQRRANIVIYNNYDEMQQSNIGLGIDWQNAGGITKLVNNKMIVYFDGNHDNLKKQIRQGLAKILVDNVLFGDDLGEFAANQALLDLPKWLTDGYVEYAAEYWSPALDDELRAVMLSGEYSNFYQFAFQKPLLAGHGFWKYIAEKYGRNKTTYFLYLARIYRNLNNASQKVTKKKFKKLLQDFMIEVPQQYFKDIRGRRNTPKGQLSISEVIGKKDYIRFNASPVPRSFTYAMVEFKQGKYTVVLMENFVNRKELLKLGVRSREEDKNPNYPLLAWDGKGTRLAVVYSQDGKLKLFVYDIVNRFKGSKQELKMFDQVQDVKYMLDANTLIISGIKSGQSDIYVYKIDKQTIEQITNDVYDDLDPTFVAFPNKTGIMFSSNRPNATAASSDDSLPSKRFNIFLVDNWNKSDVKQISQLTNLRYGNARFPSQYNTSHFTFVSDENGINNRYAGFFKTERAGLDTLVFIGGEMLRNPVKKDVDSLLREWNKTDIDSVGYVSITNDSAYVFPLTNYQNSLLETRTAGDNQQVSEVVKMADVKLLYRLKVDENTLRRRNVTARPTEYMRKVIEEEKKVKGKATLYQQDNKTDTAGKKDDLFVTEFRDEKADSSKLGKVVQSQEIQKEAVLKNARVFEYRPPKFFNDYLVSGFNNSVLVSRYQDYQGGNGPVQLSNGDPFNGILRVGTSDLFEDWKFAGGFRISPNLDNNEYVLSAQYLKKRIDYGFTYYRNSVKNPPLYNDSLNFNVKQFTNLYQASFAYPFSRVEALRINFALRFDKYVVLSNDFFSQSLKEPDRKKKYALFHAEYVHDDAITPAQNIWYGLRWKVYADFNALASSKNAGGQRPYTINLGFDGRHYLQIYRNIIWAVRAAGDFSWGREKIIYYLGGVDNWLMFGSNQKADGSYRYFNETNKPDPDVDYAFQSLAVSMRGFRQNAANGNNAVVINSEVRAPVFTSFFNKPINNAFLRNFQIVQFFDLGTAWNGAYDKIERPFVPYGGPPLTVKIKAGGIGPFAGGYGFGARSTLLGYFLRFDAAWEMNRFFKGRPMYYFAMGLDF